jgi:hypothetical protein
MKRFAIATGLLALAACGSEKSGTIETPDGKVEYTATQDGADSTFTAKTEEGEVKIASGPGQTVTWPDGFSLYPGATVVDSSTVTHSSGSGVRVVMTTVASPVQVAEFYRKQAKAVGIAELTEATAAGQVLMGGKSDDGVEFNLTASGSEGTTTANLFVAKGF